MELNEWWLDVPTERYWMEITDRTDLGADLHAPQFDDSGRDYWSYELVTAVQPGDIVIHWHKRLLGTPGIVAYSVATSGPTADEIEWTPQGTYGRVRPSSGPRPSWRYHLTGYTPLEKPVGQEEFRRVEPRLRAIQENLKLAHRGPLYFPFAFSDKRPVRAAQGYLVKFPREILAAVPRLSSVPEPTTEPGTSARRLKSEDKAYAAKRESGYITDAVVKLAIERFAVEWVMDHYEARGYAVTDVGATESFDVLAVKGKEIIHVEVKGSSGDAEAVELTVNEVRHARSALTHLVVVDLIEWVRRPDGTVMAGGGRVRKWEGWQPADASLKATRYRYKLPTRKSAVVEWIA